MERNGKEAGMATQSRNSLKAELRDERNENSNLIEANADLRRQLAEKKERIKKANQRNSYLEGELGKLMKELEAEKAGREELKKYAEHLLARIYELGG